MPSSVYVELENSEAKVGPERDKLESPSAGTGFETPGQQCPPNEGIWEQGRTIANGFLTADVDSSQGGRIPSPTESVDTRADKSTIILAAAPSCSRATNPEAKRTSSSTPVEKERRPRLGTRL